MHMLASFPSIRIGLMVGIGAAIPKIKTDRKTNKNRDLRDIRLGDVVVSQPDGSHGGVKQYDFGKAIAGGDFQCSGFLNSPPRALLNAVGVLRQLHGGGESDMPTILNQILGNLNNATPSYEYPGPELDHLFEVTYKHPEGENTCDDCDVAREITRPDRPTSSPRVHAGVIASGNQVIKDPVVRDRLGRDCICFEMEATGLMNDFPCLVIRGICDYADSHKNDCWQRYAAAVAAACAKEILHIMPGVELENERLARDVSQVIEAMEKLFDEARRDTKEISRDIKVLSRGQMDKEHQAILKWLTPVDYVDDANQHNEFISRRQPETGQWFLASAEFRAWLSKDKQTLFCPGIPGAGKTIITSLVVDYLQNNYEDPRIAYLYCNVGRQAQQTPDNLFGSVLKQLAWNQFPLPKGVRELYNRHKDKQSRPGLQEILEALQSTIAPESRTFIIIDALDECQNRDSCRDNLLSEIFTLQAKTRLNIFATSRPQEVEARFSGSIVREIIARDEDIEMYLDGQISLWEKLHEGDLNRIRQTIKTEITKAAGGMFLLAILNMNTLQSQETEGELRDALGNLAMGENKLDEAYRQTMERVKSQGESAKRLAMRTLAWIYHAKRPLSTVELLHALAVRSSKPTLDKSYLPNVKRLLGLCAGLVRVDKSNMIDLIHQTTRDYFKISKETWFPDAESDLATICATYLSFDVFASGFCQTGDDLKERLRSNEFYDYAAKNWGHHAREASPLCQEVIHFLQCESKVAASGQVLMAAKLSSRHPPTRITGLHLASYFGVQEAVEALLRRYDVDLEDSSGGTPLLWAAEEGHKAVIKLLIDGGADVNAKGLHRDYKYDNVQETALTLAVKKGHEAVFELLIDSGADVDAKLRGWSGMQTTACGLRYCDQGEWTPLTLAVKKGDETMVRQLLAGGAGVNATLCSRMDTYGWRDDSKGPHRRYSSGYIGEADYIGWASYSGSSSLLDGYSSGYSGGSSLEETALTLAAEEGHGTVVQLLLNGGADVNAKRRRLSNSGNGICNDVEEKTALTLAVKRGHKEVVKLLLENEADLSLKDDESVKTQILGPANAEA